jgi:hypothetical protein
MVARHHHFITTESIACSRGAPPAMRGSAGTAATRHVTNRRILPASSPHRYHAITSLPQQTLRAASRSLMPLPGHSERSRVEDDIVEDNSIVNGDTTLIFHRHHAAYPSPPSSFAHRR